MSRCGRATTPAKPTRSARCAHLPIGSIRRGVLSLPVSDYSEKRMFRRLKVAFELGSSSAI
jgi:hypothetical protein